MSKKNKNRGITMSDPEPYEPVTNKVEEPKSTPIADAMKNAAESQKKTSDIAAQPEVKKAVSASKTTTPKPTSTPVRQNTNLDKIKTLTSKFEQAFDKREETISSLISICNFLNTTNDPKVFQTFATWFMKNSATYMNDECALRGIHTIQNKKTKTRVEATHQCFTELARVLRSRPRGRYRFTIRAMRALEISERLASWLIQRSTM